MADGSTARGAVLDLSQGGVRLKVRQPDILPEQFLLKLGSRIQRWSRIAWCSGQEIGVEFLAASRDPTGRVAKRSVLIRCPKTGKHIPTGIRLTALDDLNKISRARRLTQCSLCNVIHGWTPADAYLEEL
jgi:PilZ domain